MAPSQRRWLKVEVNQPSCEDERSSPAALQHFDPLFLHSARISHTGSMFQAWPRHWLHKVGAHTFPLIGTAEAMYSRQVLKESSVQANCFTTLRSSRLPKESRHFPSGSLPTILASGFPFAKSHIPLPHLTSIVTPQKQHSQTSKATSSPPGIIRGVRQTSKRLSFTEQQSLESWSHPTFWFSQKLTFASCKHKTTCCLKGYCTPSMFTGSVALKKKRYITPIKNLKIKKMLVRAPPTRNLFLTSSSGDSKTTRPVSGKHCLFFG